MEFQWHGRAILGGNPVHVFDVSLQEKTMHLKRADRHDGGYVASKGIVCIDEASGHTLAIAMEAINIPWSYGINRALQSVVFSEVTLDNRTFLLPIASESIVVNIGAPTFRQSSQYQNCQKFDAESELKFESIELTVSYPRHSE
ncbi:MAG: hypothetical protein OXC19_18615 [Bryobacterales bacterium]|nr:hypothetical protein [Bryobacterales bacterium]